MTPDEQFQKLTDRVDALTQSLELLSGMHRETEARLEKFENIVSDAVTRLVAIAINQDRRLNNLEGGPVQ